MNLDSSAVLCRAHWAMTPSPPPVYLALSDKVHREQEEKVKPLSLALIIIGVIWCVICSWVAPKKTLSVLPLLTFTQTHVRLLASLYEDTLSL